MMQLLKPYKSKNWTKRIASKKWVKQIIDKNSKIITPIDCEKYIHKTDKMALAALKAIPLFDKACSKILSIISEPQIHIINMSSKIRITENQVPKVYYMVQSICNKIGIDIPDLYLELDRSPNAYAFGAEKVSITVHSGLLECLEDDELYAVLAHECGHIACKHMLYHTIGKIILEGEQSGLKKLGLANTIIDDIISMPLKLAFHHWERCSELSADRVAVICCESSTPVIETMMRLAGGTTHIDSEINTDLFIDQVAEFQDLTEDNKINKALEYWLTRNYTHPLLAVRAYNAREWSKSEEFADIIKNLGTI